MIRTERNLISRAAEPEVARWNGHDVFKYGVILGVLLLGMPVLASEQPKRHLPFASNVIRKEAATDTFGYPLAVADKVEIVRLVKAGDIATLDRVLSDYERDAEADFHREDWIGAAIEAVQLADPEFQAVLDRWVDQMPGSAVARLARAGYWSGFAMEARGTHWVANTTSAQLDAMHAYLSRARGDARQALVLNPRLVEAFRYLVNIENTDGQPSASAEAFARGIAVQPCSFRLRAARMNALLPRWGGSYEAMEALAADSEQHVTVNPRLRVLRGYIAWDRGRLAPLGKLAERRTAFQEALSFGPHWLFLRNLGNDYAVAHEYEAALRAYSDADAQVPQNKEILSKLAVLFEALHRADDAKAVIAAADAFDLVGAERDKRARIGARLSVASGYQAYAHGNSDEALAALKQAQKTYPPGSATHYWQGRIHLKQGDRALALDEFQKAVQANPRDIDSLRNIDYLLARQGKWQEIIAYWDQYIRLEPTRGDAYLERGGAYKQSGNRERGLVDVRHACELGVEKACQIVRRESAP